MFFDDDYIESVLAPDLQTILEDDVEYDEEEAKDNKQFMQDAISGLIRVMCNIDPLFKEVYNRLVHAGSFYEGLRITSADEFDLQLVLEFPFQKDAFTISMPNAKQPFVTYQLNDSPQELLYSDYKWRKPFKKLSKFVDRDGFLSSHKVLEWVHGIMEQALESDEFTVPRTVSNIQRKSQSSSCPAFTLEITGAYTGTTISVDLVPVLDISGSRIPRKLHKSRRFRELLRTTKSLQWFLVPKPPKESTDVDHQNLWRSAFPAAELQLLSDTGCLKDMIKIFKRLRDLNGNWRKPLYSYSIKAFFMRKFDENPDLDYWSEDNLGQVFLESLEAFQDSMEMCFIPDYFNPKANMLDHMNPNAARNISGRIKNITNLLRSDPDKIKEIFCSE